MTTAQVADRLGRSVPTVIRLVNSGKLAPATKLPGIRGAYMFTRESVDALAKGGHDD